MSDILAIIDPDNTDTDIVAEIARRHPDRVTVLVDDGGEDWGTDDSPRGRALRDRVARVVSAIEQMSGLVVVGLVGSREQLRGWRFDRVVGGPASAGAH